MPTVQLTDRMMLAVDSTDTPQQIALLCTLRKPAGAPEDYVQRLADRLREFRTFAAPFNYRLAQHRLRSLLPSYQVLDDDEIDLDFHLRLDALARPGDQRQLNELVSRMHSHPLDPTRPMWEFHLIDGLEDNRFAVYSKMHHAMMDGVGASRRLQRMFTTDGDDQDLRAPWTIGPDVTRSAPASAGMASRVAGLAVSVTRNTKMLGGLARAGAGIVADALPHTDSDLAVVFKVPASILNGPIGRHRTIATQSFDFERIRAVAKAAEVTVNETFLAISAGALRRYLADLGELPATSLTVGAPVNVREDATADITNAFTMTAMKLFTDIDDPADRIAAIHRSSTLAKGRLVKLTKPVAKNYPALFLTPFAAGNVLGVAGHTPPPFNVMISNIPGPIEPQYWAGAPLEVVYPIGPVYHGSRMFIASFSGSSKFGIAINADRNSIPHLQRLADYMTDALDELELAVL